MGITRRDRGAPPGAEHQLEALRGALARAEDGYVAGIVSREAHERHVPRLKAEIAGLERQVTVAAVPSAVEGVEHVTAAEFRQLPLDRQRAVIGTLLEIRILPVRRGRTQCDPGSIEITRRNRAGSA